MAEDNFSRATQAFLQWFKSLPDAQFSDSITLQDLRHRKSGRGIVATRDIEQDETLFTIPRHAIMNSRNSTFTDAPRTLRPGADPSNRKPGDIILSSPDAWTKQIMIMIHEYLLGDISKWKPYFDVIPETFETPMFWSDAEVEELQASALRSKIGRASADEMIREKVLPEFGINLQAFPRSCDYTNDELVEMGHRMGSAVMAYGFDLEEEKDEEDEDENEDGWVEDRDDEAASAMVPMADMMNADAEFNAHVNHEERALVVKALRPIKKGEEVLNYYGPHPNSELLRRYGYVTEKHSRYDVVEIPWHLVQNILQSELGAAEETMRKIREKLEELEFEDTFVLERETGDPDEYGLLTEPARFTSMPEDLMDQLKSSLKIIMKAEPNLIPDKRKRDEVQVAVIGKTLRTLLTAYATTLEEDEQLLKQGDLTDRLRMTIVVRAGEKKLLGEAIEFLRSQGDGQDEDDGQTAKRRKTNN